MTKSPDKAIALFKKILRDHNCKEAWLNLGTCYKNTDKIDLAIECVDKANDPRTPLFEGKFLPIYPIGLNNRALLHYTLEEDEKAAELYNLALKHEPDNLNCVWNLAELTLRRYSSRKYSDLSICWDLYEYRLKRAGGVTLKNKKTDLIEWDGSEHVASMVVLTEQGHGDMIMFARYLSLLKTYCDKIWIQCDPSLAGLFSDYNICLDPTETDATHGVPMCSLGKHFASGIPAGDWLKDKYVKHVKSDKLQIGVAWSGNADHVNDRNRSTSSGRFLNLSRWGELYTLNPTEHHTKGFNVLSGGTFASTLQNLSKLDLVITVDTALAHLCGAAGMECWVIMPLRTTDFRWGDTSMGYENIWYPSVRVIRNPCSWEKTFEHISKLLEQRIEGTL